MPDLILTKRRDRAYITAHSPKGAEFLQTDFLTPIEGVYSIQEEHAEEFKECVAAAYGLEVEVK